MGGKVGNNLLTDKAGKHYWRDMSVCAYESGVEAGLGVGPAGGQRDLVTGQPNLGNAVNMKTKNLLYL